METLEILVTWRRWQEAQQLSERTIAERARTITHLLEYTGADPLELTPDHIIHFMARRDVNATSASSYHATIRAYCKWLVKTDRRLDDPSVKTPTPKRPARAARPLATGNLATLLEQVTRKRTRMMILLAAAAGLRVHEIAKFHGEDLDRHVGSITVTGKGGSTQVIPAHDLILELAEHFPADDYWFKTYEARPRTTGEPHVSRQAVYDAIKGAMQRASIRGVPHQLRHWYATTLLDEGVDVRIVQELLRHKSIGTTQLYTRVHWRQMVAGMARLKLPTAA